MPLELVPEEPTKKLELVPDTEAPQGAAQVDPDVRDIFKEGVHTFMGAPAQIASGESPSFDGLGQKIGVRMIAAGHSVDDANKAAARLTTQLGRNEGFAGLVMGPMQAALSPILGPIRTYFSRPIEESTGFPKEVTEGLINVGLSVFGMRAPKPPVPKIEPYVKPVSIQPIEGSPIAGMPRSEAAKTGIPEVDAVLDHPTVKHVIDNAIPDRSHTVPYEAGGSVPLDDPTTYIDKHVPQTFETPRLSDPSQTVKYDTAEPTAIHENVEEFVMDRLIKGGMTPEEAYRVAHFEYAEKAEQAWYAAHDIDPAGAEAEWKKLQPGIQHEIANDTPPNLYRKEYPGADVTKARHEQVFEAEPTPEESQRAQQILANDPELQGKSAGPDLQQAKDLGVIGEGPYTWYWDRGKPIKVYANEEISTARAKAADRKVDDKITQEVGGENPWQANFSKFVGKLEAPGQVRQLILDAAKENNDFLPARQGDIPLHNIDDIAIAAGVNPEEINQKALSKFLNNPARVRGAMQMMLEVTKNVTDAARDVRADGSPENLIKLQEAIMRRDMAVENVVGLRAEWGKTGNVFQEFLRDVKDQEGLSNFLKDKGRSPKDLKDIADAVAGLNSDDQVARFMNDQRKPGWWDKFMYYWVNALISGPVTHTKYVIANAAFAGYESAVVTPVAGAVGAVRRGIFGGREGVFAGEAAARMWGIVAGVPDAIVGAARAARTGLQTALPGEIAQNIVPKMQRTIAYQQKPIEGILGTMIGIPSRGASAIHSFFNFMGYRASMEAQAYRLAVKEGLRPTEDAFWQRRSDLASQPTIEMMNEGIEEGYRLTYISELGPTGKKITAAVRATKVGQLLLPFMHIPFNILARGLEGTPLAFLPVEVRANLMGRNGAVKQDMAIARLVAGSAVGAWAVNLVLNDRMTGFGPTEPAERQRWLLAGHIPYGIRIGDEWYSMNRFGSIGTMMGIHANLAEAIPHMKPESEELTKALAMTVHATGRLLEDEVGMQGLAGLIEAINEPERRGARFVSSFAGSLLPYSSLLRQTASAMDPSMREAKTVTDGLRYYIPAVRQGLLPKRDWTGNPIVNPGYGGDIPGAPGLSAVIQHRAVNDNPVDREAISLNIHTAPPQDRIGGVKLPPGLYDQYQSVAGPFTRHALESLVNMPGWYELPPVAREMAFRQAIKATRAAAGAAMQASHPEIIQQGIQQRIDHINGQKPTKLKD